MSHLLFRFMLGLASALVLAACGAAAPRAGVSLPAAQRAPDLTCQAAAPMRFARLLEARGGDRTAALRDLLDCRLDEVVALTETLVSFQTIAEITPPASHEAFLAVADWLAAWAESQGLLFEVVGEHDAYVLTLPGTSPAPRPSTRFLAHIDVVPVTEPAALIAPNRVPEGWSVPPFSAQVRDGALWGRGSEDDKGPIAAVMVCLAALAEAGVGPRGDVILAMGTGEEHSWAGMRRYATESPAALHEISIDSGFPVTVGESGFVYWGWRLPANAGSGRVAVTSSARATSVEAGLFHTQVPDRAVLDIQTASAEDTATLLSSVVAAWEQIRAQDPVFADPADPWRASVEIIGPTSVRIAAHGLSAHSSRPEDGRNALWLLARLASQLDLEPSAITSLLALVDEQLVGDHYGERLGLAYADAFMGRLSVSPTRLYREEDHLILEVNMRRPRGLDSDAFEAELNALTERLRGRYHPELSPIEDTWVGEPHFVDPEAGTTPILLDIYRELMDAPEAEAISSRGSTYARLFPGAVSFGPSLPGVAYSGHGADEHIDVELLERYTRMLFEAIVRLSEPGG